jgi:hypothetical protein
MPDDEAQPTSSNNKNDNNNDKHAYAGLEDKTE